MERGDLTGQVLDGRYRVLEPLGQGGMGSVYRAEHLKLGRIVAVKVMNEQVPNEMSSRRRFDREAMAMAKLEHPHCASVLDVGMHEDKPFVVMDFVSGTSLKELVDGGPVPIARAVEITRQILSGLSHAHERGIVHRDIKPANIVLSHKSGLGDHVKILDFGLAKMNQETSNLTRGVVVGTPSYMAPEQIRGLLIDQRADLYACGVLLFELVTGGKPFRSANNEPLEVCMMHLNNPAPRLADRLPGQNFGALEAVVARALEKDRDQRFANAGDFAAALLAAVGRPSVQTPPAGVALMPEGPPQGATVALPAGGVANVRGDAPTMASMDPIPMPVMAPPTRPTPVPPPSVPTAPLSPPSPATAPPAPEPIAPPPSFSPAPPERSQVAAGTAVPAASPSKSRWIAIAVGGALLAGIVVTALVMSSGGSKPSAPAAAPRDASAVVVPEPSVDAGNDAVAELVKRALEMSAAGRREGDRAIDFLVKARKTYPDDARLPYHAGMLYMDKMWWADGLKQLRAAIELDPAYKTDPDLIKAAIRGFNTTKNVDWPLASFLRKDIGEAAKPYIEDTAANHPNPLIRKRATAELRHYR